MKIICCAGPEKHYYDADRYDKCPHCKNGQKELKKAETPDIMVEPIEKGEKKEEKKTTGGGWGGIFEKITTVDKNKEKKDRVLNNADPETQELINGVKVEAEMGEIHNEIFVHEKQMPLKEENNTLQGIVNDIQGTEPKTIGFWGVQKSEPVVGWLVCVSGPDQGGFYALYAGKNTVGREAGMTVQILNDNEISRHHTVIKYDPKSGKMKVLPGEGNGLVYLAGEDLDLPTELKDRDILEMGKSKLMLVLLCGPDFTWDDWIEDK